MAILRSVSPILFSGFALLAGSAAAAPQDVGGTWHYGAKDFRLMPLGDSLTEGVGAKTGYRGPLQQLLNDLGIHPDFVGSANTNPGASFLDQDHEGHGGYRVSDLISHGFGNSATTIEGWVSAANPDVILLHIGTNDISNPLAWQNAVEDFDELLSKIYGTASRVTVLVAKILPTALPTRNLQIEAYNRAVALLVREYQMSGRDIRMVDMESIESPFPEGALDPVHPAASTYQRMAERWAEAIADLDQGALLVPPAPVPLGFAGVQSSSFDGEYLPAAAVNGSGLSENETWFQGNLHSAEGSPSDYAGVEPANAWRSAPFPILWQSAQQAVPGIPVWYEARFTTPREVHGLELWAGRTLEFIDPTYGTDFRVYDAPKQVYIWTLNSNFEWDDRGAFDLRRPPRTRRHPGEWFDVDWEDVLRIRIEVLELDTATLSPDLAPGEACAAISELRLFENSVEVGALPTSLVSLSRGGRVPIEFASPALSGFPYRVLGSGLWEFLDQVALDGYPLGLVADLWFEATLAGLGSPLLVGGSGELDETGSAEAWFELPPYSPDSWAGAKLRHRIVGFDASGTKLSEVGSFADLLLVP